jgi:hypothetical protein
MDYSPSSSLSFTRDQIKVILGEFITTFKNPVFIHDLQHLAPNEERMNTYIESKQKEIFQKHNLNPEQGYKDLSRIRDVYP